MAFSFPGNQIVQEIVSIQQAPIPATLQEMGAIVSQGATNLSTNSFSLLRQLTDLQPLLNLPANIASMSLSGGTVTVTTTEPHDLTVGDTGVPVNINNVTPTDYNGYQLVAVTGTDTFTYPLSGSPGSVTVQGTWNLASVNEVLGMVNTFFAQGTTGLTQGVFILELGPHNTTQGVASLAAWIAENLNTSYTPNAQGYFYVYCVPPVWDGDNNFIALINTYLSPTARTYFWTTTDLNTYSVYTGKKNVFAMIEDPQWGTWPVNALTAASWSANNVTFTTQNPHGVQPGQWFQINGCVNTAFNGWWKAIAGTSGSTLIAFTTTNLGTDSPPPGTLVASYFANTGVQTGITNALFPGISFKEYTIAAPLYWLLNLDPGIDQKVPPFAYTFLYGVTSWPQVGTNTLLATLRAANINFSYPAAEGGLVNNMVLWGTMGDGNPVNYWYSVDWVQINLDLDTANAVINGSNNPLNPLYYNQEGINRLQGVAASTMRRGIAYGLVNGSILLTELDPTTFTNNLNAGMYNGRTVINAVPFLTYAVLNPSDYQAGRYAGLSVAYTPQTGFTNIVYTIVVTEIVAG